jgi:hypothetical protein
MAASTEHAHAGGPPTAPAIVRSTHRFPNLPLSEAAEVLRRFASTPGAVTTDEVKGVIVVSETEGRMPRLMRIIRAMEQARPGDQLWVEPGLPSASSFAQKLTEVLDLGTPTPRSVTSLVGDDESQTLVIVAEERAYTRLLELIARNRPSRDDGTRVSVLPLEHADAADVARDLQPTVAELGRHAGVAGPHASPSVYADLATNCLVIRALPEEIDALRKAARDLDQLRSKVVLDVIVAEAPASTRGVVLGGVWIQDGALSDEARRVIRWSKDPRIVLQRTVIATDRAPERLTLDMAAHGARSPVLTITPHFPAPDVFGLDLEVAQGHTTTVVLRDEEPFAVHPPGVERQRLFVIVKPHRYRGESDLRRIFERRMEEQQAYLDHYAVFGIRRLPPLHIDRSSKGLLAVIRLAQLASR